jgi:hypothetical protein
MTSAISSARDEFEPAISAYFKMIPADAPEHAKAQNFTKAILASAMPVASNWKIRLNEMKMPLVSSKD